VGGDELSVCAFVCLFVRERISRTCPIFTKFLCVCHLLPLLGPRMTALRYVMHFRFMDDELFAHNGQYGGLSISLRRVTSLRRRAQANAPAVSYWLCRLYKTTTCAIVQGLPRV